MKADFYPKLAVSGMRKNSKLYAPYLFTCAGMVLMYYIITALSVSPVIRALKGGDSINAMLEMGSYVIAVFAVIFLFYTQSFLSRRRKKEFGLYIILGMGKRNIARILFYEALFTAVFSMALGFVAGIALFKLAELGLTNMMHGTVNFTLTISVQSLGQTALLFGGIFLLIYLNTLRQISLTNPIALLKSEAVGEKPPKANWVLGGAGVVLLAVAYAIALSIKNPLAALVGFFIAVVLVIVGTYLLFVSGSVALCRLLQKFKGYYYKANHFVSVSSMVYRMKRNGAGLASICILATMVLVVISTTASLYFGTEDSLRNRFPRDMNLRTYFKDIDGINEQNVAVVREKVQNVVAKDQQKSNELEWRYASVTGQVKDGMLTADSGNFSTYNPDVLDYMVQMYFIPLDDYNRIMQTGETLAQGEALLYTTRTAYPDESLTVSGGNTLKVTRHLKDFFTDGSTGMDVIPCMFLVVSDLPFALQGQTELTDQYDFQLVNYMWEYVFDSSLTDDAQIALRDDIRDLMSSFDSQGLHGVSGFFCESLSQNRDDFYGLYGGLFFLGILLSLVFILAAVLIIYYKQISEGYEDQSRFAIMQNVGMTKKEIRRCINSQLLTVFFLPLIGAGMHILFAFPIVSKMLLLFNLNNTLLFAGVTALCFVVFGLFYALVYRATSNAYYAIVSEK